MALSFGNPLKNLNGRHRGETIFVIGAGPQLAHIPERELKELESRTTIGVNMTFYKLAPTYFLSAYIGQVILARQQVPQSTLIHMRPVYKPPLVPGTVTVQRKHFDPAVGLTNRFSGRRPTLFTKRNVALGATHLAYILGARQIAYIGVEQRNQLHFWHFDEALRDAILDEIVILRDVPYLTIDHPYDTYENLVTLLKSTHEECRLEPFYKDSHEGTFRDYFGCLQDAGVQVLTTDPDSVVRDAGASYVPLSDLLA